MKFSTKLLSLSLLFSIPAVYAMDAQISNLSETCIMEAKIKDLQEEQEALQAQLFKKDKKRKILSDISEECNAINENLSEQKSTNETILATIKKSAEIKHISNKIIRKKRNSLEKKSAKTSSNYKELSDATSNNLFANAYLATDTEIAYELGYKFAQYEQAEKQKQEAEKGFFARIFSGK